jgi:hypothetical protein
VPFSELFRWRLESAQKYDDAERSLGDVLDVKASVAIVAVTFLAGVSAQLLTASGLPPQWARAQWLAQLVALVLLAVAGAMLVAELWPSEYASPPTPKEDSEWIDELTAKGGDQDQVLEQVLTYKLSRAVARVEQNRTISEKKSSLITRAFALLAAAMIVDLANLILLAGRTLWPDLRHLFACR